MSAMASQFISLTIVLLKRLFRRRSKKTSKLRVTGLCEGNSPGTGEFPSQRASNAENVSIWWRHHIHDIWGVLQLCCMWGNDTLGHFVTVYLSCTVQMHMILILWPERTFILFVHFHKVPLLILTPFTQLGLNKADHILQTHFGAFPTSYKCHHRSVVKGKTDFSHNFRWRTAWWYLRILMDIRFYFSQLDTFVCWHAQRNCSRYKYHA